MGKLTDRLSSAVVKAGSSVATVIKVALMSRPVTRRGDSKGDRQLVILGNGPSLRKVLEERPGWLFKGDRLAVNFAANTDMFADLRPEYYVLADPHFFAPEGNDPNVDRLWDNIRRSDWPMTLCVPARERVRAMTLLHGNGTITVKTFNMTPAEGWQWLTRRVYDSGLGMPRPRNVMIPSIMVAIREGYSRILLAGADHSWLQSLYVDDENHVVSVQPHFYADNEKEKARVTSEYAGYHLHDILNSMTVAFRSYHEIAAYAGRRGVKIINATPGSYIDAFPRL